MDYLTVSESDLLRACLDGNKEAWNACVIKFSKLIYHSLIHTFKAKSFEFNEELLNDLYQDVFLSLFKDDFKKLRQFKGKNDCSLSSWLRMIATRTAIDFMRTQKGPDSSDSHSIEGVDHLANLSNGRNLPSDSIEKLEWYQLLKRLIDELSSQDRYLFDLCYNQELPDREIAQILNLSIDAVYMRKSRLKEKLKIIIQKKKLL